MTQTLVRTGSLLLAVAILLTGHGLQLTLLPMRAETLGWSTSAIGMTGSAYFAGFVVGCITIPSIVYQVAHIRTFMVMAALATVALLGAGLFDWLPAWMILRFGTGFAFAGLYMVIESWLSDAAPPERRGSILGIYFTISLLGMVAGQGLLSLSTPGDLKLLMGGAFILGLAIIPVGLTRQPPPQPIPRARFSPRVVGRASRVAVVCVCIAGLVTGSLWAVGPLVGRSFGLDASSIGLLMAAALVGGAIAQVPVGRLSDHTDRRFVIAGLLTLGAVVAGLGWQFAADSVATLYGVMFLLGATAIPLYALCIATASDNSELSLIEIASSILIMNSFGSIIGPLLVSPLMGAVGARGFFLFAGVWLGLGALWTLHRISVIERPRSHPQRFQAIPRTSAVAAELTEEPVEGTAAASVASETAPASVAKGKPPAPEPAPAAEPPSATERSTVTRGSPAAARPPAGEGSPGSKGSGVEAGSAAGDDDLHHTG